METFLKALPYFLSTLLAGLILYFLKKAFDWAEWRGEQNAFKSSLGGTMDRIEKAITTIQNDIKGILRALPPKPIETDSPIRLNDLGRKISSELDAANWAENKVDDLIEDLRDKQPYEIQEYCFEYVTGKGFVDSDDRLRQVNDSAYNHGLDVGQVLRVVGVELRDVILKRLGLSAP